MHSSSRDTCGLLIIWISANGRAFCRTAAACLQDAIVCFYHSEYQEAPRCAELAKPLAAKRCPSAWTACPCHRTCDGTLWCGMTLATKHIVRTVAVNVTGRACVACGAMQPKWRLSAAKPRSASGANTVGKPASMIQEQGPLLGEARCDVSSGHMREQPAQPLPLYQPSLGSYSWTVPVVVIHLAAGMASSSVASVSAV
jgi:hypothetical protein